MDKLKANLSLFNIKKQESKIVIIFFLTILIYIGIILFVDLKKITQLAENFNWLLLPYLLFLTLLNYLVRALRFQLYLRHLDIHLGYYHAFSIFMSGLCMTVTPGKSGEIVKAYLLKKTKGTKFSEIVPLLIIERVTDGIAMILLALGGIVFVNNAVLFLMLSFSFVAAFIVFIKIQSHIIKIIFHLEKRYPHFKLLEFFTVFFKNSQRLIGLKPLSLGIVLGCIAWAFEGYSLYLLANALLPIEFVKGVSTALFIFSFSSIAGFFVLIPGGIGVAEGSISYFLTSLFSLSLPQSVFVTLMFRFVTLWFGVSLGLIFLVGYLKKYHIEDKK